VELTRIRTERVADIREEIEDLEEEARRLE
jgi:hypothetical protein